MQVKEVTISVKRSKDFDSYMVTKTWTLEPGEVADTDALLSELEQEIDGHLFKKSLEV